MLGVATLAFHDDVARELAAVDALLILGRGLGDRRVVSRLLAHWCETPSALVLVLNPPDNLDWINAGLLDSGVDEAALPLRITMEKDDDRAALYHRGGVFAVTARVLLTDLLRSRLPRLDGVVVYGAHSVDADKTEAFCLRLVRRHFPGAFVCALSDRPERFFGGFSKLKSTMQSLGVERAVFVPRGDARVRASLDAHSPDVEELRQPLTPLMLEIQGAIVEAFQGCMEEIQRKRASDFILSAIKAESTLLQQYERQLKMRLLPMWGSVSSDVKGLLSDMFRLQALAEDLLDKDAVNFLFVAMDAKAECAARHSPWLIMDAADRLFKAARSRVYEFRAGVLRIVLEPSPKLHTLSRLVGELIAAHAESSTEAAAAAAEERAFELLGGADILVVARKQATLHDIARYLGAAAPKQLMFDRLAVFMQKPALISGLSADESAQLASEITRMDLSAASHRVKPADSLAPSVALNLPASSSVARVLARSAHVVLALNDALSQGLLDKVRPRHVVIFDPETAPLREVECMCALNPSWPLKVHLLYYENSTEEQRYITDINKERDAFARLQEEASSIVFRRHGADEVDATLGPSGGAHKVIIDLRDLRSALPNLLDESGFAVDARTLEVGDYILSPDVCVERKSVVDFHQSARSGRLVKQATQMCRHYARPCLLIEFDEQEAFQMQEYNRFHPAGYVAQLAILTTHFGKLSLLWSKTPRATVHLFALLQRNQPPPDGDEAARKEAAEDALVKHRNAVALDVLRQLPGVTADNMHRVVERAGSLARLARMSEAELEPVMGAINARLLREFLYKPLSAVAVD